MENISIFFLGILLFLSCSKSVHKNIHEQASMVKYVNPFIRARGYRHCYGAVTVSFGMSQGSLMANFLDGMDLLRGFLHFVIRSEPNQEGGLTYTNHN